MPEITAAKKEAIAKKYGLQIPARPLSPAEAPLQARQGGKKGGLSPEKRPRHMKKIVITPNQSIGDLFLGMPQAEADAWFKQQYEKAAQEGLVRCKTYCIGKGTLSRGKIQYLTYGVTDNEIYPVLYRNGVLYTVGLLQGAADEAIVMVNDVVVFQRNAEDVVADLARIAPYTWESDDGYTNEMWANTYEFPALGVELWREHVYHPDMEKEEWFQAQPEEEKQYLRENWRRFERVTLHPSDWPPKIEI